MKISLEEGSSPLCFCFTECGSQIPEDISRHMTEIGQQQAGKHRDLLKLFGFVRGLGASTVVANFSHLVIHPDQEPPNVSGLFQEPDTRLCPITGDDETAIYLPGREPDEFEIGRRVSEYWRYFHDDLQEELLRIRHLHGIAVLVDVHTIDKTLASDSVSIGYAKQSCGNQIAIPLLDSLSGVPELTCIIDPENAGYIVGQYGNPDGGAHAIRLQVGSGMTLESSAKLQLAFESLLAQIQPERNSN